MVLINIDNESWWRNVVFHSAVPLDWITLPWYSHTHQLLLLKLLLLLIAESFLHLDNAVEDS